MEYELFISRASPYSSKVLALLGYTGMSHRVRVQNGWTRYGVLRRLTGQTMVPVLRRGSWAINDSTAITRYAIERSGRPTLPPAGAELLAWIIEDFADEWVARWAMHSRWRHREDSQRVAELIGRELTGAIPFGARAVGIPAARLIQRQLAHWGIRPENDDALYGSATRCLELLEAVFSNPPRYLFADYPTVADFALYGPLVQYGRDPTGRQKLVDYPAVRRWIGRLEAMAERPPHIETGDGSDRKLAELQPLFGEFLGTYWSILAANYQAFEEPSDRRQIDVGFIDGTNMSLRTSRYLKERLEELIRGINDAYEHNDLLFGEQGLRMERALVGRISELCETESGRRLLRRFQHVGMH